MQTHNIVSTPNIEGNISSCTTNVTSVETGRNIFTSNIKNITTNNCTGITHEYDTWQFSGATGFVVFGIVLMFVIFVIAWANRDSY